MENIHSGWLSSGKLVAPKEDNIQEDISQRQEQLWDGVQKILAQLSKLS